MFEKIYTIGLGKAGELAVDSSKFTDQVKEYVFVYGLKQMLNDVHSQEKNVVLKPALSQKKLDSLYAGQVAQARAASGLGAVERKMRELADADLRMKMKALGKKVGDIAKDVWAGVVDKQVKAREAAYRAAAEAILAVKVEPAEAEEELDLDSLLGEPLAEPEGEEIEETSTEA